MGRINGIAGCRMLLVVAIGGALACAAIGAAPAAAKGTPAGTLIENAATVTYRENDRPVTTTSNNVTVRVDEILDVVVAAASGDKAAGLPGDTDRPIPFIVTNAGNGRERFALTLRTDVPGDNFDPVCPRLYLDSNNSGVFEAASDALYVAGTNDPDLAPDGTALVFALCNIPETAANNDLGNVSLEASARTLDKTPSSGKGEPGTIFENPNGDDVDAVVGTTTARASAINGLLVAVDYPTLAKSQRVTDPNGGTNPLPGSIVTYTIEAAIASGAVSNAVVTDSIPAGTTYEPNSLSVTNPQGVFVPLTDAADADAGRAAPGGVVFELGELKARAPRSVRFRVRIIQQ